MISGIMDVASRQVHSMPKCVMRHIQIQARIIMLYVSHSSLLDVVVDSYDALSESVPRNMLRRASYYPCLET
jgi:hypothetical protein